METISKPQFVAFSTQKGGVGKSTFTALTASLLHYRLGYNVAVFDCDFPQYSLSQLRERDRKAVMNNEVFKKLAHRQFSTIHKKAYPIIQCKADEAIDQALRLSATATTPVDVIFFDLPGTVNTPGVLTTLSEMDYIFSPITADRVILESTLSFTHVLTHALIKNNHTSIKAVSLFWNQVDGRERSPLYEVYEKVILELGITLMQASVADSKRFRKEGESEARSVFRSTLLPADEKLMKASRLDIFLEEFLKIIKL